jgi:hypothetical protein
VVGIVNHSGLDGLGFKPPVGARFSEHIQTGPEAHPAFCRMGVGSPSGAELQYV